MEAKAQGKYVKGSPQKVRLVVDLIRGKKVDEAMAILRTTRKRAADSISKVLKSAVANAEQKSPTASVDDFVISQAYVDLGPTKLRRRHATDASSNPREASDRDAASRRSSFPQTSASATSC